MKSEIRLEIIEKKKLFKKLNGTKPAVDSEIKNVITKGALMVEREAKLNVTGRMPVGHPVVQTGRLRASITHLIGIEKKMLIGKIGTVVEYAPYLEFGTNRIPAYPWLYPALKMVQPKFLKDIKEAVKKSVKRWWKK